MARGKVFEHAVHDFVASLLPGATVIFDHKIPDVDTGAPRQVDVWIEGTIQGHLPITVHVSCKDHKRRIDASQMGSFIDEVRSSGASTGIIYSRAGFTRNALRKAARRGLACCQLLENAPPPVPEVVWVHQYLALPVGALGSPPQEQWHGRTLWRDYLDTIVEAPDRTLLDVLDAESRAEQTRAMEEATSNGTSFPFRRGRRIDVEPEDGEPPFSVTLITDYEYYRARIEAHRVSGSYSIANNSLRGSLAGPPVDTHSPPGEGWDRIDRLPDPSGRYLVLVLRRAGITSILPPSYGNRRIDEERPPTGSEGAEDAPRS